jgi:hypothetical protein
MREKNIDDLISATITSTIRICRNNPSLEFAVLSSAAAFAAVSCGASEEQAVKYFRQAFQAATAGKAINDAGGMQ